MRQIRILTVNAIACLLVAASAFATTTLTVGEIELATETSATVPVNFHSNVSVAAVQMDVLFDPALYTASSASPGTLPENFRVDSRIVEPGKLRVVLGAPNNRALVDGTVFRVPLTAINPFAAFFSVIITNFALSTADGAAVSGGITPTVRLLGLTAGGKINGQTGVQLGVEAGATNGSVARVEYYVGGVKIGESTSGPFGIVWTPPGAGPFVIQAIAYDSNGYQTASNSIAIVVTNVGATPIKGIYAGLVQDDPFDFAGTGYVQFATTTKSAFSVKLILAGASYAQSGTFNSEGIATVKFSRGKKRSPLTLTLQQYATNLIDQISGQLTDGTLNGSVIENATFVSEVLADRAVWKLKSREAAQKGGYTVVLNAASDAATRKAPLGDGVGTVTVSPAGTISATLTLADGTKASQGTFLSKDGHWPLFASLFGKKGVLAGDITFTDKAGVSDFDGAANASRPGNAKSLAFKDGYSTPLDVIGSRYNVPKAFERMLRLANVGGNSRLTLEDGGLVNPLEKLLTVSSKNAATPVSIDASKLALKLSPANGTFGGSFINPDTGKKAQMTGVVFQKQNLGSGFFTGGLLGGGVTLDPNPSFPPPGQSGPQGVKALPTVAIVTPKEGARINAPDAIDLAGTAKGKLPIGSVGYQVLYQGIPGPLQAATGTATWNASVQPAAKAGGLYKIFVKATDSTGNESDVVARSVFYAVPTPLSLTIVGAGDVTKGFAGITSRDIGASITITAKAKAGHQFTGWSGSITSSAPTITFTMIEGFALQATFQ